MNRKFLVAACAASLAACDGLLEVEQPGLITEEALAQQRLISSLVAAAEGEYHIAFNWVANSGAAATDEAIFAHVWSPWEDYDERDLAAAGCPHDNCGLGYDWMQRARVTGTRSANQLAAMSAPAPARARALIYAGFSTVMLADHLCQVPLNGGPPLDPSNAYDSAVALFQQALTLAGGDPSLTNLANVGIARSYLNRNSLDQAIQAAQLVDPAFEAFVRFVDSPNFGDWVDRYNLYHRTSGFISPTEFSLGLDPAMWTGRTDLRVPYEVDSTRRMFSSKPEPRHGYVPFIPFSFEGWTPGNRNLIPGGADIRFASGLEAQHIIAEASLFGGAGGWSQAQVRGFIDQRRAVGGHGPFAGANLEAELREQRMMDFYFAGYRMPDLIRYQRYHSVNLWPTGAVGGFPQGAPHQYGAVACWPVGQSEVSTNPNFP